MGVRCGGSAHSSHNAHDNHGHHDPHEHHEGGHGHDHHRVDYSDRMNTAFKIPTQADLDY